MIFLSFLITVFLRVAIYTNNLNVKFVLLNTYYCNSYFYTLCSLAFLLKTVIVIGSSVFIVQDIRKFILSTCIQNWSDPISIANPHSKCKLVNLIQAFIS